MRLMRRSGVARAVLMMSTACLLGLSGGCRTRLVVIPADYEVSMVRTGETVRVERDMYLVGPARMRWMLQQLSELERRLEVERGAGEASGP